MAVNPMQRKANNSFLLGMLITLLITGLIIAFLILQVSKLNKEKQETDAQTVYAYVITANVKSGTEITSTQVKGVEMKLGTESSVIYSSKTKDSTGKDVADQTGSLFPTGLKAKVDLHPGTVVTSDVTYEDELVAKDVRKQEFNIITLPTQLEAGEYIDVRLRLPSGQDYIVVSHKEVEIPTINGVDSTNCIWINLSETEILMMSSAIIDAYKAEGSMLYATRYVEPGMQEAATETYLPSDGTITLMAKDPNAVQEAKNAIFARNNDSSYKSTIRNPINNATNNEDAKDNVIDKTTQEIQGLQEEREKYLESLE